MLHKKFFFGAVVLCMAAAACQPVQPVIQPSGTPAGSGLPNPASVFCEERGGRVDLRADASGAVTGFCVFADGSECEEWAYYRGECQPAGVTDEAPVPEVTAQPASGVSPELDPEGWKIYRNMELGYSFHFPAEAEIMTGDDPLNTLTVQGPALESGETWPVFSIAHPGGRDEFLPPEGADLAQWLADHNLAQAGEQDIEEIAGTPAVHIRQERSPQTYAFDRYFFAHAGQLYEITIGHTGDKEDWELYNRFLGSFAFNP